MLQFDNNLDASYQAYLLMYRTFERSVDVSKGTTKDTGTRDSSGNDTFSASLLYSDATIKGPRFYQPKQAVSVVQSYIKSTQSLADILDDMNVLVDQVASGGGSAADLQSKQSRFESLAQQYQTVIRQRSSQDRYRLNNSTRAIVLYVTADYTLDIKAADLTFAVSRKKLRTDRAELSDMITQQQAKVAAYQDYLESRLTLIQPQASTSRIDITRMMGQGMRIENINLARQIVKQIVNEGLQQGRLASETFHSPTAARVLLHLNPHSGSFLWMLNE